MIATCVTNDVNARIEEYHIPRVLHLWVRLTDDGWYAVSARDLPGLITQAKTKEELLSMVNDAVLTYFDVPKRLAESIYSELILERN